MYREGGTERYDQVCRSRRFTGPLKGERIETLSEANGRRLEVAATVAERRLAMNLECGKAGLRVAAPMAGLTFHNQVRAV